MLLELPAPPELSSPTDGDVSGAAVVITGKRNAWSVSRRFDPGATYKKNRWGLIFGGEVLFWG